MGNLIVIPKEFQKLFDIVDFWGRMKAENFIEIFVMSGII